MRERKHNIYQQISDKDFRNNIDLCKSWSINLEKRQKLQTIVIYIIYVSTLECWLNNVI